MTFQEYTETIKAVTVSDKLEYQLAVYWLHPDILPQKLISLGNEQMPIIKVPPFIVNKYGKKVKVISFSKSVFGGNDTITEIILPPTVTSIPEGAFSDCKSLRNIMIPKAVKIIREGTFVNCESLENVYYEGTPEEWSQIQIMHHKHEVTFGELVPGTPINRIVSERTVHLPGNDALLTANIHFNCSYESIY